MFGSHAKYESGRFHYHDYEITGTQWSGIDALLKVPARFASFRCSIDTFIRQMVSAISA